jgi:hypothetical protein
VPGHKESPLSSYLGRLVDGRHDLRIRDREYVPVSPAELKPLARVPVS